MAKHAILFWNKPWLVMIFILLSIRNNFFLLECMAINNNNNHSKFSTKKFAINKILPLRGGSDYRRSSASNNKNNNGDMHNVVAGADNSYYNDSMNAPTENFVGYTATAAAAASSSNNNNNNNNADMGQYYTPMSDALAPNTFPSNDFDAPLQQQQETVQSQVEMWKQAQRTKYASQTQRQQESPREENGRMKLLLTVSKGSRAIIFFVMMLRSTYLMEVVDFSFTKDSTKRMMKLPLMILFVGNLIGTITSFYGASHSTKKRLKAILNLDKIMELAIIAWAALRLTMIPTRYIPNEVFVSNIIHSIFFIVQCQAYTRVNWDEGLSSENGDYDDDDGTQLDTEDDYYENNSSNNFFDQGEVYSPTSYYDSNSNQQQQQQQGAFYGEQRNY